MARKILSLILSFGLLFQQAGFSYAVGELNLANYLSAMPRAIVQPDRFRPPQLRYISYDLKSDDFKLLLDKGDAKELNGQNGPKDKLLTQELLNYFLIGLSLPNDTFWVNLRPDAADSSIIDPLLEKTDIGKIFLESDLQLKKDTASFTSPQTPEGKQYWDKLYKKAGELFGSENITIPTITRPWIVPNEVIVRETDDSAYIYKATLKVMLEEDYLKSSQPSAFSNQQYNFNDPRLRELNQYSTQLIKDTIIPKLTQEVNSSQRYAKLRQVYYSLVLSRWFKMKYQGKPGEYPELIDRQNLTNLASQQAWDKQTYFSQYQESFAKGEYNLKETVASGFGQSIRSYVSGGIMVDSPIIPGGFTTVNKPVTAQLVSGIQPVSVGSPISKIEFLMKISEIGESVLKALKKMDDDDYHYVGGTLAAGVYPTRVYAIRKLSWKRDHQLGYVLPGQVMAAFERINDGDTIEIFIPSIGDVLQENIISTIKFVMPGVRYYVEGNVIKIKYEDFKSSMEAKAQAGQSVKEDVGNSPAASPVTEEDKASTLNKIVTKFQSELSALSAELKDAQSQLKKTQSLLNWLRFPFYMREYAKLDKALTAMQDSIIKVQEGKMWWDESETLKEKLYAMNNIYRDILGESLYSIRAFWNKAISKTGVGKQNWIRIDDTFNLEGGNMFSTARDILLESYPATYGDMYLVIKKVYFAWMKHKYATSELAEEYSAKTRAPVSPLTGVSSAVVSEANIIPEVVKRGGIDLTDRAMRIKLERVGSFSDLKLMLPGISNIETIDLDNEFKQIQAMVSSSIRPSDTRILEFAAACYYKGEFDQRLTQITDCIKNAHLADEGLSKESSDTLRLATMLPDALYAYGVK